MAPIEKDTKQPLTKKQRLAGRVLIFAMGLPLLYSVILPLAFVMALGGDGPILEIHVSDMVAYLIHNLNFIGPWLLIIPCLIADRFINWLPFAFVAMLIGVLLTGVLGLGGYGSLIFVVTAGYATGAAFALQAIFTKPTVSY